MKITLDNLRARVLAGINKLGYKDEEATIILDVLLYAQLRDNNQGITKIATGGVPKASELEEYRVVKTNKCSTLLAGGLGMVTAHQAVDVVTTLAEQHGVGIVGINHTFTSTGAIGYYARRIAEAGYIGLMSVGAPPLVAPFGSNEPKLGTNPISYAFPTTSGPIVFDTTTAAIAFFGVVEAKLNGQSLSEGQGFDADGQSTTNPAKVLDGGAIATLAGHKGYGLSVWAQMLGGPFVGGWFLGNNKPQGNGIFMLAIDPGLLSSKEQFIEQADVLSAQLRVSRPIKQGDKVYMPGEKGD